MCELHHQHAANVKGVFGPDVAAYVQLSSTGTHFVNVEAFRRGEQVVSQFHIQVCEPTRRMLWSGGECSWGSVVAARGGLKAGQSVLVPPGAHVILDESPVALNKLVVEGTLEVPVRAEASSIDIRAARVEVRRGGAFLAGSAAQPLRSGFSLTLLENSTIGPGNAASLGLGDRLLAVRGGRLEIHTLPPPGLEGAGAQRHWTRLLVAAAAGSNTLRLADAAVDWEAGDQLAVTVLPGVDDSGPVTELVELEEALGAKAVLRAALPRGLPLGAVVVRVSRKAVIESDHGKHGQGGRVLLTGPQKTSDEGLETQAPPLAPELGPGEPVAKVTTKAPKVFTARVTKPASINTAPARPSTFVSKNRAKVLPHPFVTPRKTPSSRAQPPSAIASPSSRPAQPPLSQETTAAVTSGVPAMEPEPASYLPGLPIASAGGTKAASVPHSTTAPREGLPEDAGIGIDLEALSDNPPATPSAVPALADAAAAKAALADADAAAADATYASAPVASPPPRAHDPNYRPATYRPASYTRVTQGTKKVSNPVNGRRGAGGGQGSWAFLAGKGASGHISGERHPNAPAAKYQNPNNQPRHGKTKATKGRASPAAVAGAMRAHLEMNGGTMPQAIQMGLPRSIGTSSAGRRDQQRRNRQMIRDMYSAQRETRALLDVDGAWGEPHGGDEDEEDSAELRAVPAARLRALLSTGAERVEDWVEDRVEEGQQGDPDAGAWERREGGGSSGRKLLHSSSGAYWQKRAKGRVAGEGWERAFRED
ncbi:hypothetical protein CYMTET_5602 [Cymbomonas tetramitiformis]|uniref:G8 domain-containing protein n=1 Tax=Cymbomonas tetramitiformis TaxID=36881 RepID=A0AAE0GZA9_9CHLO|nr:hypothetical protein CYMTET_5602 [Cymbomonas tetramitiformis]